MNFARVTGRQASGSSATPARQVRRCALAALGLDGPPLTAGLRFAVSQGRVVLDAQPLRGAGFPGFPYLVAALHEANEASSLAAAPVTPKRVPRAPAEVQLAASPSRQARYGVAPDPPALMASEPGVRFHRRASPCKSPAQGVNQGRESPRSSPEPPKCSPQALTSSVHAKRPTRDRLLL